MSEERKDIRNYYSHTLPERDGVSVIDLATQPHIGFNPKILPQNDLEIFDLKGVRTIRRVKDKKIFGSESFNPRFIYLSNVLLSVPIDELSKPIAQPIAVQFQSEATMVTPDGYTGGDKVYEHLYRRLDWDDRLQQSLTATNISSRVSDVLRSVSIKRFVLEQYGDITYGSVILKSPDVTDKLDVRQEDGNPVFLDFIPEMVLATTYGPGSNVLKELSYDELERAGIKASFTNEDECATLNIASGPMSLNLHLGKVLKPDYPQIMWGKTKEKCITDSGILVLQAPFSAIY